MEIFTISTIKANGNSENQMLTEKIETFCYWRHIYLLYLTFTSRGIDCDLPRPPWTMEETCVFPLLQPWKNKSINKISVNNGNIKKWDKHNNVISMLSHGNIHNMHEKSECQWWKWNVNKKTKHLVIVVMFSYYV